MGRVIFPSCPGVSGGKTREKKKKEGQSHEEEVDFQFLVKEEKKKRHLTFADLAERKKEVWVLRGGSHYASRGKERKKKEGGTVSCPGERKRMGQGEKGLPARSHGKRGEGGGVAV